MEQEPKKQDEDELKEEDLDKITGGTGSLEPPRIAPRSIVPKLPNITPKLPSGGTS